MLFLKKAVPAPGTSKKKMKELVIRSLYVEMLGNDASFAYIKAVELCASTSIAQKRAGYLAGENTVELIMRRIALKLKITCSVYAVSSTFYPYPPR